MFDSAAKSRLLTGLCSTLSFLLAAFQAIALFCAIAQPAYAYVDPGSGLFALQLIGTSFAGMLFLIRKRLRRIIQSLRLGRNDNQGKL